MVVGAKLFRQVLFYRSKSRGLRRATVRQAGFLFLDVNDSVSSLIRESDESGGSFIFVAIKGASW